MALNKWNKKKKNVLYVCIMFKFALAKNKKNVEKYSLSCYMIISSMWDSLQSIQHFILFIR